MIFLFKKPKIVLDCFTYKNDIYSHHKIDTANKYYPKWWLDTPKSYTERFFKKSTIKKCRAIIDNYSYGFIIPLWSELAINITDNNYEWQFADCITNAEIHDSQQWNKFANPNYFGHMKIFNPWAIFTNKDIKFNWIKPFWNHSLDSRYHIPEGIVDFKYNHATHINLFLDRRIKGNYLIPVDTPMVHLIPMTEKEVILKHHIIEHKEWNTKVFREKDTFQNTYNIHKAKMIKKESKCPFSFLRRKDEFNDV